MTDLDDLIRRSNSGDPQMFEALMLEHYNPVNRLTHAILHDAAEAEDAAQETFIKAATSLDQYQPGTNLRNWLVKIAVNICRDKLRRSKVRQRLMESIQFLSLQGARSVPGPEDLAELSDRQNAIRSAVNRLGEKQRLPVLLRYIQGMSVAEISQILDINQGTVHSRLHYAAQKLREELTGSATDAFGRNREDG